ncbi:MAG: HhH-GPD-type base excision DNA repair protein [Acidimicrobiales bacterium]
MLHLSGDAEADKLISKDPLALLVGFVLDQQIPLEKAFSSPRDLRDRLGGQLDAAAIAEMGPEALAAVFSKPPALHRFPVSNAERVQQLCRLVVRDYDGRPARIWETASSAQDLLRRVRALPGFGDQKAKIFVAFLGKQMGVRPPGWEDVSKPFGDPGTHFSVADITGPESLLAVRAHKAEMKAAAKAGATR